MLILTPSFLLACVATLTAIVGVVVGVRFSGAESRLEFAIPLSAGLLVGIAVFGLLPELAQDLSWVLGIVLFAAGFAVLAIVDRAGWKICPDCSHDHTHAHCSERLHGFATPLLIAAALHSLMDGWAIAASAANSASAVRIALPAALILHKLPEGFALGGMLRPSVRTQAWAVIWAISAELATVVGALLSIALFEHLGSRWTSLPLALAGGFFLFLGFHALFGEWKRNPRFAVLTGLAGLSCSALLQSGIRSYFGSAG